MTLFQLSSGYRYNCDSLFLYDFIANSIAKSSKNVAHLLDIGCGCGILGLLLKRDFDKIDVCAIDIQEINCEISKFNAKFNSINLDVICGNFLEFKSAQKFDIIVSNPPFYNFGSKSANSHLNLSRYSQNIEFIELLHAINQNISAQGRFYFCYDARFLSKILCALIKFKFNVTKIRFVHSKREINAKLVMIEAKKSSKSVCEILPPLISQIGGEFTLEAKVIFTKADTKSANYIMNS